MRIKILFVETLFNSDPELDLILYVPYAVFYADSESDLEKFARRQDFAENAKLKIDRFYVQRNAWPSVETSSWRYYIV